MSSPKIVIDGPQRLKRATRDLQEAWAKTKEHWNDQTARDFEAQHLETILPTIRYVLGETNEHNELFRKAIETCRDDKFDDHLE